MDKPIFERDDNIETPSLEAPPQGELLLGFIQSRDGSKAWVTYEYLGCAYKELALATMPMNTQVIGRQVALGFINGDIKNPIILGCVQSPLYEMLENFEVSAISDQQQVSAMNTKGGLSNSLNVDGKTVIVEAQDQLQLRCGASSIILTQEGKILIRGKYLLNRASGVNRIVGGSVQVN